MGRRSDIETQIPWESQNAKRALRGSPRVRHLAPLAVLVLCVTLFHARGLAPGRTFLPVDLATNILPWRSGDPHPLQNWLVSDPLYQYYPFLATAVRAIREGHGWLTWNPAVLTGHPVAADPSAQPFYPVFVSLGLAFGAARGYGLGLWLHAVLAAALTYGFLRTLGRTSPAAAAGALAYALGGYMVTWFETAFWISTLTWLPGVLWAFELGLERGGRAAGGRGRAAGAGPGWAWTGCVGSEWAWTGVAGFLLGLAILGGQLQFVLTFSLFLGYYAAGRTIERVRRREPRPWRPTLAFAMVVGLALLVGAVQILPFAEFLPLSRRLVAEGLADALPAKQLVTLLVPDFFGNPAAIGAYWGQGNHSEYTIYAGIVALALAVAAPLAARRFETTWIGLGALVAWWAIAGGPGVRVFGEVPVLKYASLHRSAFLLPLLAAMLAAAALSAPRLAARPIVAVVLGMSTIVGVAWFGDWGGARDHWDELRTPLLRAALLVAALCLIVALRDRRPGWRVAADWAIVGLVYLDLFLYGSGYNPTGRVADLVPPTPAVAFLRDHVGPYRAAALQRDGEVLFGANVLSSFGIAEAGGYSSLVLQRYHQLVAAGDPEIDVWWMRRAGNMMAFSFPATRLLDLLQVTHVVAPASPAREMPGPPFDVPGDPGAAGDARAPAWREAYRDEVVVYERTAPLPRAFTVYAAEPVPADDEAVARLLDNAFDPWSAAVTVDRTELPRQSDVPATPAEVRAYDPGRVVVQARAARPGLLVLGDQFYPGWRATVDGRPAPILRVNHVWRGVRVAPGEHTVVFTFAPRSLLVGGLLSIVGVGIAAALGVATATARVTSRRATGGRAPG